MYKILSVVRVLTSVFYPSDFPLKNLPRYLNQTYRVLSTF